MKYAMIIEFFSITFIVVIEFVSITFIVVSEFVSIIFLMISECDSSIPQSVNMSVFKYPLACVFISQVYCGQRVGHYQISCKQMSRAHFFIHSNFARARSRAISSGANECKLVSITLSRDCPITLLGRSTTDLQYRSE